MAWATTSIWRCWRSTCRALSRRTGPDLVFYVAGADPYEGDRLGRLKLTMDGLRARDALVFDTCRAAGLPVALSMAGGYAADVEATVAIHASTIREAARHAQPRAPTAALDVDLDYRVDGTALRARAAPARDGRAMTARPRVPRGSGRLLPSRLRAARATDRGAATSRRDW